MFAIGYAVFLWTYFSLIGMERVSPDLLMAGFVYLAVGLLLRLWARPQRLSLFVLLGAVLGFGYLAKAPVFPLAFLFFAIAWILVGDWRKAAPRVVAAILIFLAVSAPWFIALSRAKGRFTFGDSGSVNYVFFVNHAGPAWYFQNLGTAGGHYTHRARKIFDAPPIYEFATPLKGTEPIWYDPSYWADGAVPRVSLKEATVSGSPLAQVLLRHDIPWPGSLVCWICRALLYGGPRSGPQADGGAVADVADRDWRVWQCTRWFMWTIATSRCSSHWYG